MGLFSTGIVVYLYFITLHSTTPDCDDSGVTISRFRSKIPGVCIKSG